MLGPVGPVGLGRMPRRVGGPVMGGSVGMPIAQEPLISRNYAMPRMAASPFASRGVLGTFHKGGKVKQTGNYRLKKGERVLTAAQQRRMSKMSGARRPKMMKLTKLTDTDMDME